jgi:endonuclease/exonuclease/phosphatase family metal-dependent hydrolase
MIMRAIMFIACAGLIGAGLASCARSPRSNSVHDAQPNPAPSITRVMTFNIRFAGGDKGEHSWSNRRDAVADRIAAANCDIVGLQEVEALQADWIRDRFPAYAFHGVGRLDGIRQGEFAPILYRAARYELLDAGHFWISTTPDVPGSKSWNTACERMASWVRLRDLATTRELIVINTHLDHVSAEAREQGVRMIRERAQQLSHASLSSEPNAAPCPVIITGDFNTSADGPLGVHLCSGDSAPDATNFTLRDAYRVADPTADGDEATFNAWKPQTRGERIDWIFASSEFDIAEASIDRQTPNGVLPSDHYPVVATLRHPAPARGDRTAK